MFIFSDFYRIAFARFLRLPDCSSIISLGESKVSTWLSTAVKTLQKQQKTQNFEEEGEVFDLNGPMRIEELGGS